MAIEKEMTGFHTKCGYSGKEYFIKYADKKARQDISDLKNNIPNVPTKLSEFENDAGYAKSADVAATKYASTSQQDVSYFKIADFGDWGTGNWAKKCFSMLITSRAGETVWVTVTSNDSATAARAIRLMNTHTKIAAIYYSEAESAIYVEAAAWVNNVCAHILMNVGGDYVPSVSVVSGLASDCVNINIVEFGVNSSGTVVGDASVPLALGGSADRPTYNGANMALASDVQNHGHDYLPLTGGTVNGATTFFAVSGDTAITAKSATEDAYIGIKNVNDVQLGYLGFSRNREPMAYMDKGVYLLHSGNFANYAAPAYTYGTADLEAGSSELETGKVYFVYE